MNQEALDALRHTLAHLLAVAVKELYPHAQPTIGPAIDNGFYYDFDFSDGPKPSEAELTKIEQKMREHLKHWDLIQAEETTEKDARAYFEHNPYKLELINEILDRKEVLTLYHSDKSGEDTHRFTDLCRGGHAKHPNKEIPSTAFCLDRIAGAYWRGDEHNPMLTRIYGLAFENNEALVAYKAQREEARKRDHRKLGKELDLFTFSELVGAGLPLWTPRGTIVRHELDAFVWELRSAQGYERVTIPHITKKELYEMSGHWDKFAEELFKVSTREGKQYALKPMNCPHHTQIFARRPHSYREMPQRYAETTMVYRDEQSGELGGLTRVLSITQDDSHIFCRASQLKEEYMRVWDIVETLYTKFDFSLRVRLSFHEPSELAKYIGTKEIWEHAENTLRAIAQERNADFFEAPGEAAMYGPKLDFMATDSLGREHQVATIQLDMNLPERFDLSCVNETGEKERIVMIHSAIMGSIERFAAVLLEHLGGILPYWLAPEQLRILPVSETHVHAAEALMHRLLGAGIRTTVESTDSLGKRIRAVKQDKVPYYIVLGDKELDTSTVALETRDGKKTTLSTDDLHTLLLTQKQERSA